MNILKKIYARTYQGILYLASNFLSFKEPKIYSGSFSIHHIFSVLKDNQKNHPLIVTDDTIYKLGLTKDIEMLLSEKGYKYDIYHNVRPNPTVDNVEEGLKIYISKYADCVIALGGGSSLDCAKIIASRATNYRMSVNDMKGLLHIKNKPVLTIAIPTTAGTGSETTVAAVIVDTAKEDKYAINDPKLIPSYAILEPRYLICLPKSVTSTTGMDALTHAIEAFIGRANTRKTKKYAIEATKLIFDNLEKSCLEPENLEYREAMQLAAYKAGVAFTRAYVGMVHALAHALGGKYNVPHGLANAIILPFVLKAYGHKIDKKLATLADLTHPNNGQNVHEKAQLFIQDIEDLNDRLGIKNNFKEIIKDEDIDFIIDHSYKEAYPLYPLPVLMDKEQIRKIILKIKET